MPDQVPTEETSSTAKDPLSPTAAAEHRSGAAYSADLVSISRNVLYAQAVLIAMVAAIFFMAGYVLGPGRAAKDDQPIVKKEKFGKSVDVPGRITYSGAAGDATIDAGAVVILLPKGTTPGEQLAAEGLRPTDSPSTDWPPAVDAIKFLGGAYMRADELGEIDMQVKSGRYYVLVISNASSRRDGDGIKIQDAEEMQRFFEDPQSLVGDRRYEWKLRKLGKETLLNISLD